MTNGFVRFSTPWPENFDRLPYLLRKYGTWYNNVWRQGVTFLVDSPFAYFKKVANEIMDSGAIIIFIERVCLPISYHRRQCLKFFPKFITKSELSSFRQNNKLSSKCAILFSIHFPIRQSILIHQFSIVIS